MRVNECKIINPSPFIQAVYKYAKDRNKLKFHANGILNCSDFEDYFVSQLEKFGGGISK